MKMPMSLCVYKMNESVNVCWCCVDCSERPEPRAGAGRRRKERNGEDDCVSLAF